MHFSSRSKMSIAFSLVALAAAFAGLLATGALSGSSFARAAKASAPHKNLNCGVEQ